MRTNAESLKPAGTEIADLKLLSDTITPIRISSQEEIKCGSITSPITSPAREEINLKATPEVLFKAEEEGKERQREKDEEEEKDEEKEEEKAERGGDGGKKRKKKNSNKGKDKKNNNKRSRTNSGPKYEYNKFSFKKH